MKKFLLVLLVPLVVSAAAIAAPNPASVNAHCNNLLRQAPALFGTGAQYANLAACVAAKTAVAAQNTSNAQKVCTTERDDAAFPATHGQATFADFYGTGNNKNAFGKCVSSKASSATAAQQTNELNAAKKCKQWRANAAAFLADNPTANTTPPKTFAQFFGTNKNNKNAFGKCVSKLAKAQHTS